LSALRISARHPAQPVFEATLQLGEIRGELRIYSLGWESVKREVAVQRPDLPHDTAHPLFPLGFGLTLN
jgi:hypothetical protein